MPYINFWAIAASMILSVVLGFIWYGPLFGKPWMRLSGIVMPEQKPSMSVMIKPAILSLIGAFFLNFILASNIAYHAVAFGASGMSAALSFAFAVWIGFIVPVYLNLTGWEGKPWALFFINSGYWLVYLLLAASIIVSFV